MATNSSLGASDQTLMVGCGKFPNILLEPIQMVEHPLFEVFGHG